MAATAAATEAQEAHSAAEAHPVKEVVPMVAASEWEDSLAAMAATAVEVEAEATRQC